MVKVLTIDEMSEATLKIINAAWGDGTYSSLAYELAAVIVPISYFTSVKLDDDADKRVKQIFALSVQNELRALKNNEQYKMIMRAADNEIKHRLHTAENTAFSATDIALTRLLNTLTERISKADFNKEEAMTVVRALSKVNKPGFNDKMSDIILMALKKKAEAENSDGNDTQ